MKFVVRCLVDLAGFTSRTRKRNAQLVHCNPNLLDSLGSGQAESVRLAGRIAEMLGEIGQPDGHDPRIHQGRGQIVEIDRHYRLRGHSSGAERLSAAAGGLSVGVVDFETRPHQPIDVVQGHTVEVETAL